ncbi:protein RALF-like 19 [Curcuma longa]|uniref:protein RALF-like 19 n=1 Tax=Curcuma longa TaxID=136217 RepID=UPI003D9EE194
MALHLRLAFLLLLLLAAAATASVVASVDSGVGLARIGDAAATRTCDALTGECGEEEEGDDEMDVEGEEDTRRFLYGLARGGRPKFISYAALKRNRVPCDRRGNSYYNCQRSGRANPYRRGCTIITHCARILH